MSVLDEPRDQLAKLAWGEQPNMLPAVLPDSYTVLCFDTTTEVKRGEFVALDSQGRLVSYGESNKNAATFLGILENVDTDGKSWVRMQGAATFTPWPAPYTFPAEVTITPEPYRSLDADARTRTAEWQESVRKRFERRVGAALTSTSLEGLP